MAKAENDHPGKVTRYVGWLRLDNRGWLAVCVSDGQESCEEALAKYKKVRDLTMEGVVLPKGLDPHPGHSTYKL